MCCSHNNISQSERHGCCHRANTFLCTEAQLVCAAGPVGGVGSAVTGASGKCRECIISHGIVQNVLIQRHRVWEQQTYMYMCCYVLMFWCVIVLKLASLGWWECGGKVIVAVDHIWDTPSVSDGDGVTVVSSTSTSLRWQESLHLLGGGSVWFVVVPLLDKDSRIHNP